MRYLVLFQGEVEIVDADSEEEAIQMAIERITDDWLCANIYISSQAKDEVSS